MRTSAAQALGVFTQIGAFWVKHPSLIMALATIYSPICPTARHGGLWAQAVSPRMPGSQQTSTKASA